MATPPRRPTSNTDSPSAQSTFTPAGRNVTEGKSAVYLVRHVRPVREAHPIPLRVAHVYGVVRTPVDRDACRGQSLLPGGAIARRNPESEQVQAGAAGRRVCVVAGALERQEVTAPGVE